VVVTGNHYVFEIAAGLVVTAIGRATTKLIPRRLASAPLPGRAAA
jgi:hypothetical protein